MSVSPQTTASVCQSIPERKLGTGPAPIPHALSTTPGGTLYGTTPGGTKIIYDRSFLMTLRESPISKTPPACAFPAGVLRGASSPPRPWHSKHYHNKRRNSSRSASIDEGCETFSLEL